MNNNGKLIRVSFFLYFIFVMLCVYFRIAHWPGFDELYVISSLMYFVFIIPSIIEILKSNKVRKSVKGMWVFGIVFIAPIVGLIYVLNGRKRI